MDDRWLSRPELARAEKKRQLTAWMWEFGVYVLWLTSFSSFLLLTQNDPMSTQYAELHRRLVESLSCPRPLIFETWC
eukprot:1384776-Rhodomonas_salina.1